jgi:hypothetical protein
MQHAEAHERLADLALEPYRLAGLEDDAAPEVRALRAHLVDCQLCAAELEGWRRTWMQVGTALSNPGERNNREADEGGMTAATGEVFRVPASLRSKTMSAIAAEGRTSTAPGSTGPDSLRRKRADDRPAGVSTAAADEPAPTRRLAAAGSRRLADHRRWMPWIAAAAALVIALGAGSLAWTRTRDLDRAQTQNAGLTATMASLDRVLATPVHWTTTLRTPDGTAGGTVAWTASEIAVITSVLPAPPSGRSYRCWVERDGVRTPIGPMWFSGSTGYWAGDMGGWADLLSPGARFGVSVIPGDGGPGTPVLVGTL